jgi:hypothetical protein
MNFSKAAISFIASGLISGGGIAAAAVLLPLSLRLLESLDLRELAVDWLPWLESVLLLVEPRDRELACFGKVL